MHPSTLAKRVYFLLLLAIIVFYFYGLGHLPLVGPDEPRYAQVAREMFLRRDLITPTLGGHTWFEKPALLYWLMIGSYRLFGVSEWAARLGPAICGLSTIFSVWSIGRSVERSSSVGNWRDFGLWSGLIATSCLGLIVFSRAASFDIVITATTSLALCCFIKSELTLETRDRFLLLAGFYVFVGLSLIAKGLVGVVIPFGVVGVYYLLRRRWPNRTVWLSLVWGLPLTLVAAAPWYGPVIAKHGWLFIDEFFVQHHFARYVSNKYHHPQPIYFYPAILLMLVVPWTPLLVDALIGAKNWKWRDKENSSRFLLFALAWVLFPVVFFSFSGSKLPGYILPTIPAASLLIASALTNANEGKRSSYLFNATGVLCLIMSVAGVVYCHRVEHLPLTSTLIVAVPFALAGLGVFLVDRTSAILTVATSVLVTVVLVLNFVGPSIAQRESVRDLLFLADLRGYSTLPVLALRGDDRSAEFYASGRVVYGDDGEPVTVDQIPDKIAELRSGGKKILAFVSSEDLPNFEGHPGIEVIGDNGKLALLCVF